MRQFLIFVVAAPFLILSVLGTPTISTPQENGLRGIPNANQISGALQPAETASTAGPR